MGKLHKFMNIFWKDKGPSPQPHPLPPPLVEWGPSFEFESLYMQGQQHMSNNTPSVEHIVVCAEKFLKKIFFYNFYLCLILIKKKKERKKRIWTS